MPVMRRTHYVRNSELFRDDDDKKDHKNTCKYGKFAFGVLLLLLTGTMLYEVQENALLMDSLQDCLYDVEGHKKDLKDSEDIIDALEASLVLVEDLKQAQSLSIDYSHPRNQASTATPYRLADVLQLPPSLNDEQVMSVFQAQWSVNDNPLYGQCGLVTSREVTAAMRSTRLSRHAPCNIAVVTSWAPRACGIATYSSKLVEGLTARCPAGSKIDVLAVRNPNEPYDFYDKEPKVTFSFQKDIKGDNDLAAEHINSNHYDVVILSYEFGIFGDEYIMCLLKQIGNARIITILHTVAHNLPWQKQALTEQVMLLSHKVVVMTETMRREVDWLHRVPGSLLQVIPHGVPSIRPSSDSVAFKSAADRFNYWNLNSDMILFSNGLLHQGKGIEHVLAAMPTVLQALPQTKYIIQGAPHPTGEGTAEYYQMLKNTVQELNLEDHVFFSPEFLSDSQLVTKLQHSSVFINAYVDTVASVSGTLIMAMGAGVPCISTPYPFAREMLADQSGVLVPFGHPENIAKAVVYLLSNPEQAAAMGHRALKKTHGWQEVANMFIELAMNI